MSDIRLIDANELKKDFAEFCATECPICSFYIPNANVGECHCGLIDRAPTIAKCGRTPDGLPFMDLRPQNDLIKAFELLKAHCKNRECNKNCVFYRELRIGDNIDHQYCGLCEIVLNDDEEAKE